MDMKKTEIKQLAFSLLAIEIIAKQKGVLTKTKQSNTIMKIKKGNPVGCKVTLRKTNMFEFLNKINNQVFPKLKNFYGLTKILKSNTYSFKLQDLLSFEDLEKHYYLFKSLKSINITISLDSKNKKELCFVLKSMGFYFEK